LDIEHGVPIQEGAQNNTKLLEANELQDILLKRAGSSPARSPSQSRESKRHKRSNPEIQINIEQISDASSNSYSNFF
jgi:hypothetical protein